MMQLPVHQRGFAVRLSGHNLKDLPFTVAFLPCCPWPEKGIVFYSMVSFSHWSYFIKHLCPFLRNSECPFVCPFWSLTALSCACWSCIKEVNIGTPLHLTFRSWLESIAILSSYLKTRPNNSSAWWKKRLTIVSWWGLLANFLQFQKITNQCLLTVTVMKMKSWLNQIQNVPAIGAKHYAWRKHRKVKWPKRRSRVKRSRETILWGEREPPKQILRWKNPFLAFDLQKNSVLAGQANSWGTQQQNAPEIEIRLIPF